MPTGIQSQTKMSQRFIVLLYRAKGFPRRFIDKTFLLKTIPHTNSSSPEMPIASRANIPYPSTTEDILIVRIDTKNIVKATSSVI
jgi:hypothetical protein